MPRIKLLKTKQGNYLNNVKGLVSLDWSTLANICGVHNRTFFDWRRNKYQMSLEALEKMQKKVKLPMPREIEILPDTWNIKHAARLGAIKRNKLYGSPGTPEGRRKGGLISSLRFKQSPGYALRVGFIVRKKVRFPKHSALLAEFIGIIIGDGSISKFQVRMTTKAKTDRKHAYFTKSIARQLFNIEGTIAEREKNCIHVTFSSRNLVEFLLKNGLKQGDKIKQKIDIPQWIFQRNEYIKGCLRGLFDTDGGIYFHTHTTKGIKYRNIGICFTTLSKPLLISAHNMLLKLGINAKTDKRQHIFIYGKEEIKKYMLIVGSHNPKHLRRFKSYKGTKVFV